MLHTMSETVIVAALRRGNFRRAIELILDTYQDEVFGYCAGLVGGGHSSGVYQQVLTVALDELPTFNGVVSIRAWLYGIARRVVIRHQQDAQRDFSEPVPRASAPAPAFPGEIEEIRGLRPTDLELDTCLNQVAPAIREILQLTLWHGLLLAEVAHITARSLPEVRRMAAEGLSSLSGALQRFSGAPS